MTAKQILDFAEEHAQSTDMFCELEAALILEKTAVYIKLEQDCDNKKLLKQIKDIDEKLRMIYLMKAQRVELLRQSEI